MASINEFISRLRWSALLLPRNLQTPGTFRKCSSRPNLPRKLDSSQIEEKDREKYLMDLKTSALQTKSSYWNEHKAIKRSVQESRFPRNIKNVLDISIGLVSIRKNFPGSLKGLKHWLEKSIENRQLIEQKFLPQRHAILKPDLATAHFLVRRGGSVKFLGQLHWVGVKEGKTSLPKMFIPGLHIEAIKLEGTNLYYEGLKNLCSLEYLRSLSLKNVENVNDWWLDWISAEYYSKLKHLDLTNCKNITYRGLSCLYRFENLETLIVEGIPDPPEFKLACVMLQDVMPELNIVGIDLNIPEEIAAMETKPEEIPSKEKAVQEV